MAKKKKSVELSSENITFTIETTEYKVIRFYPSRMTLDVMKFEEGKKAGVTELPFAHLPKETKKLIKPN